MNGGIGYMVKRPNGVLGFRSGAWASKAGARKAFIKTLGRPWTWKKAYRRGCRVVLVDIKEIN